MPVLRTDRLACLLQEKIGGLIVENKIKDPRIDTFLSVTHVEVSQDLSYADVYVSSFKAENSLAKGVEGLQSAAGFIQAKLSKIIHIRKTPKLRFHVDTGIREGFELIQKIDALVRSDADQKPPCGGSYSDAAC
ncbi:MAG: 30S ribosome-binding factor RbfA [Termitinemataceae bacterium]|nr:MAG: 30S ribosome-binding factor RbfA [Termitinemataceae bacterium]